MDARQFFDIVKAQRKACKAFAETHSPESRDEYFRLSDQIDAEIARVEKMMEDQKCEREKDLNKGGAPTDGHTPS